MVKVSKQAKELNKTLKGTVFYDFLSEKGKRMHFPSLGIMGQALAARGSEYNATIGIGLKDDGKVLCLKSLSSKIDVDSGRVFPYAPSHGKKEFRDYWKEHLLKVNPSLSAGISLPVVCSGITHAVNVCGQLFCEEGDELILGDLFWSNYSLIFGANLGVDFDMFSFFSEVDGGFNIAGLREKLFSKKKSIVLLNFPNNPTGYSLLTEEYDAVVSLFLEYAESGGKVLVVCDDAYFGLFYEDEVAKESVFAGLAELHENIGAVKLDGPTKESYVWGLRVGCITFAAKGMSADQLAAIEEKAVGMVRSTISGASNLSQSLLLKSYESESLLAEQKEAFSLLESRYREVARVLESNSHFSDMFTALPFNSGYFMCLKLNSKINCEKVRAELLKRSIGVISLEKDNLLRFAFSSLAAGDVVKVLKEIYDVCVKVK